MDTLGEKVIYILLIRVLEIDVVYWSCYSDAQITISCSTLESYFRPLLNYSIYFIFFIQAAANYL